MAEVRERRLEPALFGTVLLRGFRKLLHKRTRLRAGAFSSALSESKCALDIVSRGIRRRIRSEVVDDAVVVSTAIAESLDALQHVEVVSHAPIVKLVGAELVEVDEASEGYDLDEFPCREAVIGPPLHEPARVGARLALVNLLVGMGLQPVLLLQKVPDDLLSVLLGLLHPA